VTSRPRQETRNTGAPLAGPAGSGARKTALNQLGPGTKDCTAAARWPHRSWLAGWSGVKWLKVRLQDTEKLREKLKISKQGQLGWLLVPRGTLLLLVRALAACRVCQQKPTGNLTASV